MTARLTATWAATTVVLTAARAAEMRFNARAVSGTFDLTSPGVIAGLLVASAVYAGVIVWLAARSRVPDPARFLAIVGIGLAFGVANDIEAIVFGIVPAAPVITVATLSLAVYAGVVLAVTRLIAPQTLDRKTPAAPPSPFTGFTVPAVGTRVLALGFIYTVVYFVAGMTIYPFVREFYADKPLPSPGALFALQTFVRGPLHALIGALVIWIVRGPRATNAAAAAAVLGAVGGLVSLVAPNPLFPDHIRLIHLAEVTVSDAVFGWIVGWMLTNTRAAAGDATRVVPRTSV